METIGKIEHLKYILNRYDHYIESVQSKSNLYIGLNTLISGGIITLLTNINLCKMNSALYIILIALVFVSVVSIIITLLAINPHLSGGSSNKSVVFFNDVSNVSNSKYAERINELEDEDLKEDLTNQVHCVAEGLTKKYNKLCWVGNLLILQFSTLLIWIIIFIIKNN